MQPDLIARIEAAQPSEARELFHEALFATFDWNPSDPTRLRIAQLIYARSYLDAAAMFVPEGWFYSVFSDGAAIVTMHRSGAYSGTATTPYFALLAAAMKARQTDERD
jgi:hypothetical protein